MSLYHETAAILDSGESDGGNLKSRIFTKKDLRTPPGQVYALALETCKWSQLLVQVIDASQLLVKEKKLSPIVSLLLVHDLLLSRGGIALPASHGLRASVERHKARLTSDFTRARIKRKCANIAALRDLIEAEFSADDGPRWIRINTLRTSLAEQLATTFEGFEKVDTPAQVQMADRKGIYVDETIPNVVAVASRFEFSKAAAYASGAIILQDKASCFPAYLLDSLAHEGDAIDACAAPGNKTTHLAAIMSSRAGGSGRIFAFEKDAIRVKTLEKMVERAGAGDMTTVTRKDFLTVDPHDPIYANVTTLLLDPSCSGSGIKGRDVMPTLHLPKSTQQLSQSLSSSNNSKKRKRADKQIDLPTSSHQQSQPLTAPPSLPPPIQNDPDPDDENDTPTLPSTTNLQTRLTALSNFQLILLLHAFQFPAARKITYSTCSIHDEENEHVVLKALASDIAHQRGWRVLRRGEQNEGMKLWPVRGRMEACEGDEEVAEGCIRAVQGDGRGTMGFFVVGFVRDDVDVGDGVGVGVGGSGSGGELAGKLEEEVGDGEGSDWGGFDE